jgi:hypothetical protein
MMRIKRIKINNQFITMENAMFTKSDEQEKIYLDTIDKVLGAMSLSLGLVPLVDLSNPIKPNLSIVKVAPSNKILRELYSTDTIARGIIDEMCSGGETLTLDKLGLKDAEG